MTRYPRDIAGHGAGASGASWPNGAKIAVQIALDFEDGGDNSLLQGDAASEAFLFEITGARAGFWRLHRLLSGLPVTVYRAVTALARAPARLAAMKAAGLEIAGHGLTSVEHKHISAGEERAAALERVLEFLRRHDGVWFATREQIADHWARTHPAVARTLPSEMDK